jgi:tRNA pseudouridine55 synthase
MSGSLPKQAFDFAGGEILLVDKPLNWTSFDVVNKIRYALKQRGFQGQAKRMKVGHAGTLDPRATGLLLIGTGKATKRLAELQGLDKRYDGTLVLGARTASADTESDPEPGLDPASAGPDGQALDQAAIQAAADALTGVYGQRPPAFSAVKVDGKRAYKLARQGKAVAPEARTVRVDRFAIGEPETAPAGATGAEWPGLLCRFEVDCGKGTYIRSLARDLGDRLPAREALQETGQLGSEEDSPLPPNADRQAGVGAYLYTLRRTAIGPYKLEDAWSLEELLEAIRTAPAPAREGRRRP